MTGVLVTGGTGQTGSELTRLLRGHGVPARVASRRPPAGDPQAVRFDWDEPATHREALRGMDRVYLVPPPLSVDPMPRVGPFLAEAERLGVRRVVLLGSAIVPRNAPGALELVARVRDLPGGVVLRPSGFMQNFLRPHPVAERIHREGEIHTATGSGRLGWIDTRDIAATACAVLTAPEVDPADPRDHLLTGPGTLSYRDAAALITEHTGRPIRVREITDEELADRYRAAGMPAAFAAALASVDAGIRAGHEDRVSTAVLELTGRAPRSFAAFVRDHASQWRAPASVQG